MTLIRGLGLGLSFAGVLLGDSDNEALEERRVDSQKALQRQIAEQLAILGLLHEEVAEQGVAGKVATQHGVEADVVAGCEAGLRQQHRGGETKPSSPRSMPAKP